MIWIIWYLRGGRKLYFTMFLTVAKKYKLAGLTRVNSNPKRSKRLSNYDFMYHRPLTLLCCEMEKPSTSDYSQSWPTRNATLSDHSEIGQQMDCNMIWILYPFAAPALMRRISPSKLCSLSFTAHFNIRLRYVPWRYPIWKVISTASLVRNSAKHFTEIYHMRCLFYTLPCGHRGSRSEGLLPDWLQEMFKYLYPIGSSSRVMPLDSFLINIKVVGEPWWNFDEVMVCVWCGGSRGCHFWKERDAFSLHFLPSSSYFTTLFTHLAREIYLLSYHSSPSSEIQFLRFVDKSIWHL